LPWCEFAKARLERDAPQLAFLPERFEHDLLAL